MLLILGEKKMESVRGASQKQDFQPGFLELACAVDGGGLVLFSAVFFFV